MELISVVVVTYNSCKTIIETLESIKNQTYENLELIVSDDHSTDNTVEIVKEWLRTNSKRFEKSRLLSAKQNHGVTKNCNIGIWQAQGKYIQIIAGDDILLEQAIEKKYYFAKEKSLNAVFCKVEPFGSNIARVNEMKRYFEKGYKIIKMGWQEQYDNIIIENIIAGPASNFYLTEYIKGIGGFDIRYPMLDDYPFLFNYIVSGNEVVLLDETLVRYRISSTSLWTSNNSSFLKSRGKFFFYAQLKELLKCKKYKDAIDGIIHFLPMWMGE
ncbi:MAG: glycosyltransferase [Lachnospiraceae bacterium]|nr:glycosyltransferase [Lachnospiraceae bacterium]